MGVLLLGGCGGGRDSRLDELHQRQSELQAEHQRQQAQQNVAMAENQRMVAEGVKDLVAQHGQVQSDLASLQREMQETLAEIGHQRDSLETERKKLAEQRQQDSLWTTALVQTTLLLACLAPLFLAAFLLYRLDAVPPAASGKVPAIRQHSSPRFSGSHRPALPGK